MDFAMQNPRGWDKSQHRQWVPPGLHAGHDDQDGRFPLRD